MPRAIWKGHVSFGLVNIPVELHSAEQANELHFNMLDGRDLAKIRFQRVNDVTGEVVPWENIVKGYEYSDGRYVIVTDEDFKRAAVEATQSVDIQDFVEADQIDWAYIDKPYYLAPGKKGEKGYVLLREALKRSKRVAVAKVVIRAREHLAAVRPHENGLVLLLLRFHNELRDMNALELPGNDLGDYKVTDKELHMAEQLVESMFGEWEPQKYHDEYREKLLAYIEQKAQAGGVAPAAVAEDAEAETATNVVNIMDLLKQSVLESQKTRKKPPAKSAETPAKRSGGKTKRRTA